jgi:hypothetical protein
VALVRLGVIVGTPDRDCWAGFDTAGLVLIAEVRRVVDPVLCWESSRFRTWEKKQVSNDEHWMKGSRKKGQLGRFMKFPCR